MNPQQKEHSEWIKENRESFKSHCFSLDTTDGLAYVGAVILRGDWPRKQEVAAAILNSRPQFARLVLDALEGKPRFVPKNTRLNIVAAWRWAERRGAGGPTSEKLDKNFLMSGPTIVCFHTFLAFTSPEKQQHSR